VGAGSRSEFTLPRLITLMVGRTIEQLYPTRQGSESRIANCELRNEEIEPLTQSAIRTPLATAEPSGAGQFAINKSVLLEVRGLSQPGVVANIDFALCRGEILGIGGLMGSGRSELARILFGLDPFEQGEIKLEGVPLDRSSPRERIRRGMAFLTENRREEGLMMEASITENLALVSLPSFVGNGRFLLDRWKIRQATMKAASDVRLESRFPGRQAARTLSGGNQQKVVLAKWLLRRPALLILDEPTRGIDIGAKQEIYALIRNLAEQATGILLISSEIEELIGMCDRLMVMRHGEIKGSLSREQFDSERILEMALSGGEA
jgi:ribose transport system ATP-binding protein